MRAARVHRPGGIVGVTCDDVEEPVLGPGDARVRVHAAGITPTELAWVAPDRMPAIVGHDVSGVVDGLGAEAAGVRIGDAVYGLVDFARDGAAADFVAVRAADLAPKPKTRDHLDAAAVPLSALTAWQALFDHAGLARGRRLLIHGAAGGVGSFALQLGHWCGAHVIGTASPGNAALVRELGADEVIDHTAERFEDHVRPVDVVLDTVGGTTVERSWRVLRPGGTLVTIADPAAIERSPRTDVRGLYFIVSPNRNELAQITALIDSGKVRPVVSQVIALARAREAFEKTAGGHNRGKVVLQILGGD